MKTLLNALLKSDKIKTIYTNKDGELFLVENFIGTVFSINAKTTGYGDKKETYGYQYSLPIYPNRKTGSAVAGTGDYYDYISFEKMVNIAENGEKIIPNFFSEKERETIHFITAEQDATAPGSIWSIKLK